MWEGAVVWYYAFFGARAFLVNSSAGIARNVGEGIPFLVIVGSLDCLEGSSQAHTYE